MMCHHLGTYYEEPVVSLNHSALMMMTIIAGVRSAGLRKRIYSRQVGMKTFQTAQRGELLLTVDDT
eukprot:6209757-Pleurochrysis_carterae.AAC.3